MASNPPIAAAVVVHANRLLLIRRRVPEGALLWTLPSGKVEPDETPAAAAAREALEEAGVTVEPVQLLGERLHPGSGRRMVYVACRRLAGDARVASPREVAEVAWVRLGEIPERIPGGLFGPVQAFLDDALGA
ncbi:NUDIX hydrolase [Streptomyces acidicola]|uniref:NUDIX domain-containing protein n=1 Tax=Streptomyces acidicola TaxID=2596892 RepID=A0A5N8WL81_9ACTN|nr:NUDIX domain-containing protein [Streptomyces acidicola]MPY47109.1 NUDIX domain-containing protein [Streptomyces acidicola]MPY47248.1 NUDIX domain-containing protein [Streptomyces acidicola]